ncbi:MAG: acetolactate synthase large subunit [Holophaga sp.]|jgi:acetolactate synthase-1/2/3 large subunit
MNGAEALVRTLLGNGVDTAFANPGTSEMHFVSALDRVPGMRCILALAEGVVTGAADGYGRMAEKPAVTLLHCGPGLANGLANLHNARRARTPIVSLVGDVATYHRVLDAPLTSDIESFARPVSAWVHRATEAFTVGMDAAAAVAAARSRGGGIATLILPSDVCWNPGGTPAVPAPVLPPPPIDPDAVERAARVLGSGEPTALLLGGSALRAGALEQAARIAAATGATLIAPYLNPRVERGRGRVYVERMPYPVDQAVAALAPYKHLVLAGAARPVIFFAYPGKPSRPERPDAEVHLLALPEQDCAQALERLADRVGAGPCILPSGPRQEFPTGAEITPESVARAVAALLPDQAVVSDESVSFGRGFYGLTRWAPPHDWVQVTGGAIGLGLPMATGAAIAAPGRRVVSLEADGSALYTVQALWTQAREKLDVTTIILANRKYAILMGELLATGAVPGPVSANLFDLGSPAIDWVKLAGSFGVEAARAETVDRLGDLFRHANARPGPFLIELAIP